MVLAGHVLYPKRLLLVALWDFFSLPLPKDFQCLSSFCCARVTAAFAALAAVIADALALAASVATADAVAAAAAAAVDGSAPARACCHLFAVHHACFSERISPLRQGGVGALGFPLHFEFDEELRLFEYQFEFSSYSYCSFSRWARYELCSSI